MRQAGRDAPAFHCVQLAAGRFYTEHVSSSIDINLTIGYCDYMKKTSKAARELAKRSVEARKQKWGKKGFRERMQAWGKLGGRPKGSGKKEKA